MRLRAFSLAEVLCTIVIIGVVAGLIGQLLFAYINKHVATTRIKSFYTLIKRVQLRSKFNGYDWDDYYLFPDQISTVTFLEKYILPNVSYIRKVINEDGTVEVTLNDSSSFALKKVENCMTFVLDINSAKAPNEDGKDLFHFVYCPETNTTFTNNGDIIPFRTKQMNTRAAAREKCVSNPEYCTGFIVFDNFEFKNDYPYRVRI